MTPSVSRMGPAPYALRDTYRPEGWGPSLVSAIGAASRVTLQPLAIREHDDDPGTFVVGRPAGGGFIELPAIGVSAIRLLESGLSVQEVEGRLTDSGDRPDVAGLLDTFVHQPLPDPIGAVRVHFPWLLAYHVRRLFSRPIALCYGVLVVFAAVTVIGQPELLPHYRDFFWTSYSDLATSVNLVLFAASAIIHELMHLAAARTLGVPAHIGLGTRLHDCPLC